MRDVLSYNYIQQFGGTMKDMMGRVLFLFCLCVSTAFAGSWETCDVVNGQIFSCKGWFNGTTVAYKDGSWQSCDIVNGQIFSCKGWFNGTAVAYKDGSYQSCDIVNGQIFSCKGWFNGTTVAYK